MPSFKAEKRRLCYCGCGNAVPLHFTDGRFKGYAKGIPGHRRKQSNDQWREFRRNVLTQARKDREKPIGTKRLHEVSPNVFYYVVKVAQSGKWPYEHRIVAAQKIGRPLTSNEQVHHINENTLDNRPENLKIVTASTHRAEHPLLRWARLFDACQRCGLTTRKHLALGLCTRCYQL